VAWALLRLLRTFVDLGEEFGHSPLTGIAAQGPDDDASASAKYSS
jgi:hypothetical protein